MSTHHVKSLPELNRLLRRHMRQRQKRIAKAVKKTARQGAAHVRRNVPVAHSELRDSVQAKPEQILADAPHAAPVEEGSRPHFPPIEPIVKWVKLRGMQGRVPPKSMKRLPGNTTQAAALAVRAQLDANWKRSDVEGNYRRLAFQIARAIAKHGTKPHWYMRNSLPRVMDFLDQNIKAALPDEGKS